MPRAILQEPQLHTAIRDTVAAEHAGTVRQVQSAVAQHPVVVVGMAQNPFPKKARKALDAAGIAHHDIDFGSYFSAWRPRLALKMWTGWPTLPMVFVNGVLVGGAEDVVPADRQRRSQASARLRRCERFRARSCRQTRPVGVANARCSPSYSCALRLDRTTFGGLLGHAGLIHTF